MAALYQGKTKPKHRSIEYDIAGDEWFPSRLSFGKVKGRLYQRLVEAARNRLAELELEYGIEKSKVDSIRSRLFGALRAFYQERDRLRLLVRMFHSDLHEHDPEKRKTYELLTQAINEARDRGDIGLMGFRSLVNGLK